MKRQKPLEIKEEAGLKARRRARVIVGPVKPGRVMTPKTQRGVKHKKAAGEGEGE